MTVVGIALSLVTLGILLYHLWEHRTEAKKEHIRDSFPEREKLAAEYHKLVGYPTQALVNNALIEVRRVGATLVDIEYLTPKEVQDKITQMKADLYDSLLEENEHLRTSKDRLTKQVEVLTGYPELGQQARFRDVQYYGNVVGQPSEPVLTVTNKKKSRKKK